MQNQIHHVSLWEFNTNPVHLWYNEIVSEPSQTSRANEPLSLTRLLYTTVSIRKENYIRLYKTVSKGELLKPAQPNRGVVKKFSSAKLSVSQI